MVTAYDEPRCPHRLLMLGVDILLVGDSVANTVLGHDDPLHIDIDVMAHHVGAVAAGQAALPDHPGDMPWMSYHLTAEDAVRRNAATLIRAGAHAVKLEGGRARLPVIEAIIRAEIPVMGHLGLTPQSVLAMGGFRCVQAKSVDAASALVDAAKAAERRRMLRSSSSKVCPTWWERRSPRRSTYRPSASGPRSGLRRAGAGLP